MIELKSYQNLADFKNSTIPFLAEDEVVNNLILGILQSLQDDSAEPIFMAAVYKNKELAFVLLQTHPAQIILSKSIPLSEDEIEKIVTDLIYLYPGMPGFVGEKQLATKLVEKISKKQHCTFSDKMKTRIYTLSEVMKAPDSNGKLLTIESSHYHLIRQWVTDFSQDAGLPMTNSEVQTKAEEFIDKKCLYLWESDGEVVAMAAASRPTQYNITINYVYTPPAKRKRGFASSCVSALSKLMLENGYKTISLYTDLDNPTSNKIYMEIGYRPVIDSIVLHFDR